ncbi:hypothetical protein F070042J6_20890 [Bacteroides sp. f07]
MYTCVRYAREGIKDREEKKWKLQEKTEWKLQEKNKMEITEEKKMAVRFIIDKRDIQKKARGCPYGENGHPL